ncbi:protein NLP7-like [Camellia sinensis]|uniref:protein NLP7-like n=1 Tax=Camellia sinensis TaxID=4442 RepID=UPI001035A87D|nr:protein NLP7-like [Camellia sinensis]
MISMEYKFYVDGDSEEELGLPGHVFRYKFLESTLDVRYYSTEEHPQGSHAVHCNVTQSLALPVFDPSSQSCVGVLELVTLTHDADELLIKMEDQIFEALQKVELEYSDPYFHGDILTNSKNDAFQYALNEIRDVLKVVCQVHRLRLAQTWVPCWFCSNGIHGGTFDVSSEGRALCTIKTASYLAGEGEWPYGEDYTLLDACQSHHLRKGQGVVRRVLSSHKLLFCSGITRFSIADYPLAHYACKFGLTGCFAICINKGHGDLQTSLSMILGTMMQLLKGFKLATGEKLRQDLSIEAIDFCNDEKLDSM